MSDTKLTYKQLQTILVQAAYGKAMMRAHHLELKLATFLMCHAVENNYKISHDAIKRMTLGVLVNEFINIYAPPEQIEEELDNMVFFRNELAHRISESILLQSVHDDWQQRVIDELATIEGYFRETDILLTPYMERSYSAINITEVDMLQVAKQIYPGLTSMGYKGLE